MLYEELLAKIDRDHEYWSSIRRVTWTAIPEITALRAVVELHSICEVSYGGEVPAVLCDWCRVDYPCKTIEVIEKELK